MGFNGAFTVAYLSYFFLRIDELKLSCKKTDVQRYLPCGHHIPDRVNTQTKNVICVRIVKSLLVIFTIIHDPHGSHVVHNLAALSVEQIVAAVIPSVADEKKNKPQLY